MPSIDDLSDRILRAVGRMSGRIVAALGFFFYAGVGLALPLVLGLSVPGIVIANFFGTMLAGLVILAWLTVQVEAAKRRHLIEWTSNLRLLDPEEFEWLVGEMFRREGWQVRETGSQEEPDGNVDLELTRPGQRVIVQCKRWIPWRVGVEKVRAFAGTLSREKLPPSAGVFVTLSNFTTQARSEARTTGLTLIDGRDLHSRIEKVRRPEVCPICQKPMVLSQSPRGWWLRCIARDCQGKRDLGREPGRAVDLLMQPAGDLNARPLAEE